MADDEIELKIKRDLPVSWSLIWILWVISRECRSCTPSLWPSFCCTPPYYLLCHWGHYFPCTKAILMSSHSLKPPGVPLLERRLWERDSYSKTWFDACATLSLVQLLHSRLMTHRIHIKLQLTGKSRLIFNYVLLFFCAIWNFVKERNRIFCSANSFKISAYFLSK